MKKKRLLRLLGVKNGKIVKLPLYYDPESNTLKIGDKTVVITGSYIDLPGLTSDPSLISGRMWYRSDLGKMRYYDGTNVKNFGADLSGVKVLNNGTVTLKYKADIDRAYAIIPPPDDTTNVALHLKNASDTLNTVRIYLDDFLANGTRTVGSNFPCYDSNGGSPGRCGYSSFYNVCKYDYELDNSNTQEMRTGDGLTSSNPADASYTIQYDMGSVKSGYLVLFKACIYGDEELHIYGSNDLSNLSLITSLTGVSIGGWNGYAYEGTSKISYRYILLYPYAPGGSRYVGFGDIGFFNILEELSSLSTTDWYTTQMFNVSGKGRTFIIASPSGKADVTIEYYWLQLSG